MRPDAAPVGVRVGARVVDVVTVAWLTAVLVVEVEGRLVAGGEGSLAAGAVALVAAGVVVEVVPVAVWGRSLGKALLGLAVTRADGGGPPGAVRSVVRWVVLFGALALPWAGWAVALLVGVTRVHDRLAGTVVVAAPVRPRGADGPDEG